MRLHSNDTSDDQPLDETDERRVDNVTVDNTTVEDSADGDTGVHPTFTPAARQAPDDEYKGDEYKGDEYGDEVAGDTPDDVAAQTPTVVEPAEPADNYPAAGYRDDEAAGTGKHAARYDEPVVGYTTVETVQTVEPAIRYAGTAADEPAAGYETAGTSAVDEPVSAEPAVEEPVAAETVVDGPVVANAAAVPAGAPADLDQPLLSGDTDLLAQWQRVQAEFVDDPQVAVAGAADLVEQAGQAMVEALQQRQRQMRTLWDNSSADGSAAPGDGANTEQLRQMMQRYRALFNQLHQPV
jgi:hypothetical protein